MPDFELPQLGYWIGEPHWGNGYATEAVQALIDLVFTASDCETIGASGGGGGGGDCDDDDGHGGDDDDGHGGDDD